jgi:hypothetical protein
MSGGGGDPRRRRHPTAGLGPVGERARVSPRGLGGGSRGPGRRRRDTGAPSGRRRGLVFTRWTHSAPGAGAGACRRPAGPLHRGSGRARALAGASRPRRLAQPGTERGVADSQRSDVARLPG